MSDDYKVNGKEYSLMSPANNRILSKLVDNEVYCDMTQEIEFIINALLEGANDSSAPFDVNDYDAAIEKVNQQLFHGDAALKAQLLENLETALDECCIEATNAIPMDE